MSFPFPVELVTRSLPPGVCKDGKQLYITDREFIYDSAKFGRIIVPAGTPTDMASIPRPVWIYLSPTDPVIEYPSVPHDFGYSEAGRIAYPDLSREDWDYILYEAMLACGARKTQAWLVHRAVRIGGVSHWKS